MNLHRPLFIALTVILSMPVAWAADEMPTTFYSGYVPQGFPAVRTNPSEMRLDISLNSCRDSSARGNYVLYIFEGDALRKFERFGAQGLDADDRKWISAYDNRKAACESLIDRHGGGSYWSQIKAWLLSWLK
jgi:hypothetical protein